MIGHSLGAHIVGIAGKHLRTILNITVAIIFGLDPARPGFDLTQRDRYIHRGDGDLVYIIHTGMGGYGLSERIGDVDVYPNGGRDQPGCRPTAVVQTIQALFLGGKLGLEFFCLRIS